MATLTGSRAVATAQVPGRPVPAGVAGIAWGSYTLAANPSQNDVIRFCRVPAGATVVCGFLQGKDIDTGTEAFDLDIGWEANGTESADTDGFGNFGVITGDAVTDVRPEVGIWFPLGGVLFTTGPQTFTNETIISGLVNAAANATGTGILTVTLFYV